jgi:hypothetical protein
LGSVWEAPTTLTASESNGGLGNKITFERVIVYPDGRRQAQAAPSACNAAKTESWLLKLDYSIGADM